MEAVLNVPIPQTSFIGREAEIGEIVGLLTDPDCRLLTPVGPGGVGKTRLSIEVANRVADHFADGVTFVPLTTLGPSDDVVEAMIDATPFEAQHEPHDPRQAFLNYLESKQLLLVLDNFEHLLDRAALLSDVVRRASSCSSRNTPSARLNYPFWVMPTPPCLPYDWVRSTILLAGGKTEMLGTLKRVGWLVGPARETERERAHETAMENGGVRTAPRAATGPGRGDARMLRPTMVGPHMILVSCPDHRSRSWR